MVRGGGRHGRDRQTDIGERERKRELKLLTIAMIILGYTRTRERAMHSSRGTGLDFHLSLDC